MALFRRKRDRSELMRLLYQQFAQTPLIFYDFSREDFIKKGYKSNAEVFSIVKKITDKCDFPPTYIFEEVGDKSKYLSFKSALKGDTRAGVGAKIYRQKALEYAGDSDLQKLIDRPNPDQTWKELMKLFRVFYFTQGEAFLYRETALNSDIAVELRVAPANLMEIVPSGDPDDPIGGWRLKLSHSVNQTLEAKDVFHLKEPNPDYNLEGSQLRGQSPLLAGLKYLQLSDTSLESWLKSVINEGAKGVLSPSHADSSKWLNREQALETRKMVDDMIHGARNRNRVAVANMPMQYSQLGLSPDALSIVEALEKSQVRLCDLWGVPAELFNPNPTYDNQQWANKRFVTEVILPYLEREELALNSWLVEPFNLRDGKKYYLDNDTTIFPELKLSKDEMDSALRVSTLNEQRALLNLDSIDNEYADEVFIEQGKIPLSDYSVDFEY